MRRTAEPVVTQTAIRNAVASGAAVVSRPASGGSGGCAPIARITAQGPPSQPVRWPIATSGPSRLAFRLGERRLLAGGQRVLERLRERRRVRVGRAIGAVEAPASACRCAAGPPWRRNSAHLARPREAADAFRPRAAAEAPLGRIGGLGLARVLAPLLDARRPRSRDRPCCQARAAALDAQPDAEPDQRDRRGQDGEDEPAPQAHADGSSL